MHLGTCSWRLPWNRVWFFIFFCIRCPGNFVQSSSAVLPLVSEKPLCSLKALRRQLPPLQPHRWVEEAQSFPDIFCSHAPALFLLIIALCCVRTVLLTAAVWPPLITNCSFYPPKHFCVICKSNSITSCLHYSHCAVTVCRAHQAQVNTDGQRRQAGGAGPLFCWYRSLIWLM